MSPTFKTLIVIVVMISVSCGRQADVHWEDGNYKVYAIDTDFKATKLGYDYQPGLLGLVNEEVVAAGSTAQCIFVERIDTTSRRTEYYVISKEDSSNKVDGPYSLAEFQEIRNSKKLPDFSWRKK